MSFLKDIARKITDQKSYKNKISKPIVKIGITGISIGITVMILTMAIVTGFQKEIIHKITTFTAHIQINDYDLNTSLEPNPIHLSATNLQQIKQLPNIKHIQSFATKNGILKTKNENEGVILKGVGQDQDWSQMKSFLSEGNLPDYSSENTSKEVLVSKTLADKLHLKTGQKLLVYFMTKKRSLDTNAYGEHQISYEPRVKDLYIKGIYNTGFSDFDKNLIYTDIRTIQKLNYWENNEVAGYEVYLNDFSLLEKSQEEINDVVGYDYTVTTVKEDQANIFSWLSMVDVNAIIIIVLMVLVAVINMISALLILILERTNMIGTLKALGMSNDEVRFIFFHVSVRLLSRGLLIGNLLGISLCYFQHYLHVFTLDASTYYLDYVPININFIHILLINVGTILCCMLMMFLPTLILTKITPIKAIRFS